MVKYVCEICGRVYETEEEAKRCEARGYGDNRFKIGDRILCKLNNRYGKIEYIRGHRPEYIVRLENGNKVQCGPKDIEAA